MLQRYECVGSNDRPVKVELGYGLKILARLGPTPTRKALLAFALWTLPDRLSQRDAAYLTGANVRYLTALAHLTPAARGLVASGGHNLSGLVNRPRNLADLILHATPAERVEASTKVGLDVMWNTMIAPLIG